MPLPSAADQVVVQGFLLDEATGLGDTSATITSKPVPLDGQDSSRPLVLDTNDHVHIRTNVRSTKPDPDTGYWAVLALATNDPDLTAYGGREISLPGDEPQTIEIPYNAPSVTVTAVMAAQINGSLAAPLVVEGQQVRAIWYHQAAGFTAPTPPSGYLTSSQTMSVIESGIDAHDVDPGAHGDIRALVQNATVADATTVSKGSAVILGGTADNPTVPYGKVTGAPASLPPSGGAGGVLSGSFPNPGFAQDMATQAELDAVAAAVPEQARDALGAALVAGANVTLTPNDAADTITIAVTVPSSYSDEQAQDAFAALIAAGTHSGISFAYNDAGNALSATVAAQTWSQITGKPTFSTVATSGAYGDLSGKPTIPATYGDLTGTVPQSALPSIALTEFLGAVASQAAMLALTGQRGDWCTRTDLGTDWQLTTEPSTSLGSWRQMTYPASPVSSVNGRTGAVTGLAEAADVTTGLAGKAASTHTHGVADLTATGTRSSSTYLRGDNTWAAVTSGGAVSSVNTETGAVVLDAADVGATRLTVDGVYTSTYDLDTTPVTPTDIGAQPADSDLTSIAALDAATAGAIASDGAGWIKKTYTQMKTALGLVKADVGLGSVDNTADTAKPVSSAQQAALDAKVSTTRSVTAGTGLTGGGDLSVDRSLAVAYGTTSATAAAGNDSRITGAVQTTRTISTTAPLTGGGDLTANRTLGITTGTTSGTVAAGDDVRFTTVPSNPQTASYTLVLADAGKAVEMNVATANTLTIPPNSSVAFPVGTVIEVHQYGVGQCTVTAGSGVTLRAPDGAKTSKQYASGSLRKRATDEWVLAGSVSA